VAIDFDSAFEALTSHPPLPWQAALFQEFRAGRFPRAIDIPTGLGKTSIVAIWLLAVAAAAGEEGLVRTPRRLVYVVNRRTVVDQTTTELERIRESLLNSAALVGIREALMRMGGPREGAFALSTLRGAFADNAEWRQDPSAPAVICGTVDMIGSRLLFGGYGCGFKSRPLHAGLLGQDALLVHDEAHLEPAFQVLVEAIASQQQNDGDARPLKVTAMTASTRDASGVFGLTEADQRHPLVQSRTRAAKKLRLHSVSETNELPDTIAALAGGMRQSNGAILVFLRRVDQLEKVAAALEKSGCHIQMLTGTKRGLERERLMLSDPVFARFIDVPGVPPAAGTVYLLCTAAGEVGVNMSADHMVGDLTPFDSLLQRLGRVNRFGAGDADVELVFASGDADSAFDAAVGRTLNVIRNLPMMKGGLLDASPSALASIPLHERLSAYTPAPAILVVSDILFDAWSSTTVREYGAARPPVGPWLHGVSPVEPPGTAVCWREEVELIRGPELLAAYPPEELLEDYPIKAFETLSDRSDRVIKHLQALAVRLPDAPAWVMSLSGSIQTFSLRELTGLKDLRDRLAAATVVLPPTVGGLRFGRDQRSLGTLDGRAEFLPERRADYDVSGEWVDAAGLPKRVRTWDAQPLPGMRMVRQLTFASTDENDDEARRWAWWVRSVAADDDGSRTAARAVNLDAHLAQTESTVVRFCEAAALPPREAHVLRLAARWHDLGKNRAVWQRSIGNQSWPDTVLAKSAAPMSVPLSPYRHEVGSLIDLTRLDEFTALAPDDQELLLHIVAAHHGRARPHFTDWESMDPESEDHLVRAILNEVPLRFAKLQRRYGRWGLAYLESFLRAADAAASSGAVNGTNASLNLEAGVP